MKTPVDAHLYEIWLNGGEDPWRESSLASLNGSILCFGPKGCGKTFLANRIASLTGRRITELSAAQILQDPAGLAAKIENALARQGCLAAFSRDNGRMLVLEDIDSALAKLGDAGANQTVVEKVKHPPPDAVIFATATDPSKLSKEEISAFRYVLPVFYGDEGLREVQLMTQAEHAVLGADVDLWQVAKDTEWWSGEELAALIKAVIGESEGTITQQDMVREIGVIGSNIVPENRKDRMSELLRFAAEYGTSRYIREDIGGRFGQDFIISSSKVPRIDPSRIFQPTILAPSQKNWVDKLRGWWPIAFIIFLVSAVIALGKLADSIKSIENIFNFH